MIFDYFLPSNYNYLPTIDSYNFAKIDLIWGENVISSAVQISIIDDENIVRTKMILPYKEISFNREKIFDPDCEILINSRLKYFNQYLNYYLSRPYEIVFLIPIIWLICITYKLIRLIFWVFMFPYKFICRKN